MSRAGGGAHATSLTILVAGLLAATFLAGCTTTPDGPSASWAADVRAHGRVGLEATLDATAGPVGGTLTGSGQGSIDTPLTLRPAARLDAPAAVYFDATLPTIGTGVLMLQGERIAVTQGSFHAAPLAGVDAERTLAVTLARTFGEHADTSVFPSGFDNESSDYFMADHIRTTIDDWKASGYERALWFSGGQAEELSGPFTFDATRMHWHTGSRVEATNLNASFDRFAWATDEPSGTLEADTLGTLDAPLGVFGQDAELRLAGRNVTSTQPFRLTQAVTDEGFLLDARIELQPEQDEVVVERGETAWARVFYRERGYIGAAVLDDVTVSGPGADLIKIPISQPPLHVQALWDTLDEYPWFAQPFAALAFVAFSPVLLLADAFEGIACAFTTCPKDHPYPVWMEPGEHGSFYFQVSGDAPEGEHPTTVTVHGANHETASFDVTVTVRSSAS